ncbi:MAG: hypothetical protein JWM09_375 [Francisellaceae bacterium]|nr:hypothetical protein [Francisellaceae bacterium]
MGITKPYYQILNALQIPVWITRESSLIQFESNQALINAECLVIVESLNDFQQENELLNKMLSVLKMDHSLISKLFLNTNSLFEFKDASRKIILNQLFHLAPKSILIMGENLSKMILNTEEDFKIIKNKVYCLDNIPVKISYSPQELLNDNSLKREAYNDLCVVKKWINP